jgi:hypothetical protein
MTAFEAAIQGRLLCYMAPDDRNDVAVALRAAALTTAQGASGLVVRGRRTSDLLRSLEGAAARQPVIIDPGRWLKTVATAESPLCLPQDGLFPVGIDDAAAQWFRDGATGVLTPSGFVEKDDWPSLKAVLAASAETRDPRVATLVATDAAMLDRSRLSTFMDVVAEQRGGRPLAFAFAAGSAPLARTGRMAGLRIVLDRFPGCLVVGVEILAAADVLVRGGVAAIGLQSSQRRPRRPSDSGGGPPAEGWMPGMFLRGLFETHSPSVYADWYANRPAPTCADCGGRAADGFTADVADKEAILVHNVHGWLGLLTELRREADGAPSWLRTQRWRAREAHRELGPDGTGVAVDRLLQALCDLDGPQSQSHTAPTGDSRR